MTKSKIAIIGAGNMGEVIIRGLLGGAKWPAKKIVINDQSNSRLKILRQRYRLVMAKEKVKATVGAKVIILAVKPQDFITLAGELMGKIGPGQIVVSIMAGIAVNNLQRRLQCQKVVRAMPNLPAKIGQGMTVWYASGLTGPEKKLCQAIFQSLGQELEVKKEPAIDQATAVSGSGPAYVFYFTEALITAAQGIGLTALEAELLVKATIQGSSTMLNKQDVRKLRQAVTSKGGTTAAALKILDQGQTAKIWSQAIKAAYKRAQQLTKHYG